MRARARDEIIPITRASTDDSESLASILSGVDAVLHCAGVNRADSDARLQENLVLAQQLTGSLDRSGTHPYIVYANSIQSGSATSFGQTKQAAADHFIAWAKRRGADVADVRLPNLFGEHGKPHYNSVVATFCHLLASNEEPQIIEDRIVPLLHVQDAVDLMLHLVDDGADGVVSPEGVRLKVSAVLAKLQNYHDLYAVGDLPDLSDRFDRALFNTYRSFCFPHQYPIHPQMKSDGRGGLFECVRARGGQSQVFCSTTRPGVTRGNHFHLRKVERFLVLEGQATISLRRMFHDEVIRFPVAGIRPAIVDIPTMWTHSITNTGDHELLTLFWADEIPESGSVDTYPEAVEPAREVA